MCSAVRNPHRVSRNLSSVGLDFVAPGCSEQTVRTTHNNELLRALWIDDDLWLW
jgi:hypothetical protein